MTPNTTITLASTSPLYFLNDAFPQGVPVSRSLLSLNGKDCYVFNPDFLPDHSILQRLGQAIVDDDLLAYGFSRYHIIPLPLEWVQSHPVKNSLIPSNLL
ncbi:MAG TPA: hypothetical protein V6C65_03875 [Allocoleopsis sp.]